MTETKQTLHVPKTRLVRDAERATEVGRRHEGTHRTLDARTAALTPTVDRFLETKQAVEAFEQQATHDRSKRDAAAQTLHQVKMRWLPSLRADLPDLDTSGVSDAEVPEDAVAASRTLRNRVAARLQQGAELAYAEELTTELVTEEERVEATTRAAKDSTVRAEEQRSEHHAAAVKLDDELIAFRATLRRVLGTTHRDYRELRARPGRPEQELELDASEMAIDEAAEGNGIAERGTDAELNEA